MSFQSVVHTTTHFQDAGAKTALLLDDCEFDRRRIKRLNSQLKTPLILEDVSNIDAMNNCLNAVSFDLIMIDYSLGKDDGLYALDMIKQHKNNCDAAKIMITGNTVASVAVSALKRGCSDYVSKKELTAEVFQQSVYDALRTARPDIADKNLTVQEVLSQTLLNGDLQDVMREAIRTAIRANDINRNLAIPVGEDPYALQTLLLSMTEEDDFIFK